MQKKNNIVKPLEWNGSDVIVCEDESPSINKILAIKSDYKLNIIIWDPRGSK